MTFFTNLLVQVRVRVGGEEAKAHQPLHAVGVSFFEKKNCYYYFHENLGETSLPLYLSVPLMIVVASLMPYKSL